MSTDKVRLAVVGCGVAGWMGHLPWIWEHPDAELAGICDSDLDRAEIARKRYDADFAITNYDELLNRSDVDGLCICTPPNLHRNMAVAAAQSKKHILLEKPMGRNVTECKEILAAAEENGIVLMMGHEKRFNFACQKIKSLIDRGDLGQVFSLDVHWSATVKNAPDRLIPAGYRENYEWRWKDTSGGGGIVLDHLPHYVDLWRWWTGSEIESISADILNVTKDYLDQPDIGVWEDFCRIAIRFANGSLGAFETGTVGRGLSPILHNGSDLGGWSEFGTLLGTEGQLVYDLLPWDSPEHGRIMVNSLVDQSPPERGWYQVAFSDARRLPGGPLSPVTNEQYMFRAQTDHFVQSIKNGTPPAVDGRDGLATIVAVEAAYESFKSGTRVVINAE
jgi:predicted dehydrogenase